MGSRFDCSCNRETLTIGTNVLCEKLAGNICFQIFDISSGYVKRLKHKCCDILWPRHLNPGLSKKLVYFSVESRRPWRIVLVCLVTPSVDSKNRVKQVLQDNEKQTNGITHRRHSKSLRMRESLDLNAVA